MKMKTALLCVAAVNLAACATVTKGSNDDVSIVSTPSNAKVVFEDTAMKFQPRECTTPCDIELPRKQTYKTTVSKDGHEPFVYLLEPRISSTGTAGMAGNVLLGGVIGAAVDANTGAMRDLRPDPIEVTLAPTGGVSTAVNKDGENVPPLSAMKMIEDTVDAEVSDEEETPVASLAVETDAG